MCGMIQKDTDGCSVRVAKGGGLFNRDGSGITGLILRRVEIIPANESNNFRYILFRLRSPVQPAVYPSKDKPCAHDDQPVNVNIHDGFSNGNLAGRLPAAPHYRFC